MSSKIKVDTIENVAGSGNVSLGSGHNLVVPGNETVGGTLGVTGISTLATTNISGNITQTKSDTALAHFKTTATNTYSEVLIQDGNAGYAWQTRSDNAQSTTDGAFLLNDRRGTFPIVIEENNPTNTLKLSNGYVIRSGNPFFDVHTVPNGFATGAVVNFTAITSNVGGHWNDSNNRFTAPITGVYQFNVSLFTARTTSTGDYYWDLRKNGTVVLRLYDAKDSSQNRHGQVMGSHAMGMTANDYVDINFSVGVTTMEASGNHNRFSGYLIG